MKKILIPILALVFLASCDGTGKGSGNDKDTTTVDSVIEAKPIEKVEEEVELTPTDEEKRIIKFLEPLYNAAYSEEYDDEFYMEHCSSNCLNTLKDAFPFDGEGYAFWELMGDLPGEAEGVEPDVKSVDVVMRNGKRAVRAITEREAGDYFHVIRTLYYYCYIQNETVIIDDYELIDENLIESPDMDI